MRYCAIIVLLGLLPRFAIAAAATATATVSGDCTQSFQILASKNCTVNLSAGTLTVTNVQPNCLFIMGLPTNSTWQGRPAGSAFTVIQSGQKVIFRLIADNYIFDIKPFSTSNRVDCLSGQCAISFKWKPFEGAGTCVKFLKTYGMPAASSVP